MSSVLNLSAYISIVYSETVSIYMYIQVLRMYLNIQALSTKILGIYITCYYESMHSIQALYMYLNIQVLGTYMPGI